jgi:hypothetical protein
MYPWLFVDTNLEHDKLLAYYHVTGFKNWPGAWTGHKEHMQWFKRAPAVTNPHWVVAESRFTTRFSTLIVPIPKEYIDAFT